MSVILAAFSDVARRSRRQGRYRQAETRKIDITITAVKKIARGSSREDCERRRPGSCTDGESLSKPDREKGGGFARNHMRALNCMVSNRAHHTASTPVWILFSIRFVPKIVN
jgi:hypothetical protein